MIPMTHDDETECGDDLLVQMRQAREEREANQDWIDRQPWVVRALVYALIFAAGAGAAQAAIELFAR